MKEGSFDQARRPESRFQFTSDEAGFVRFGDVSRQILNQQAQYGSRYLGGWEKDNYPNLGEGLRIQGKIDDYHNLKIHKDDIEEFVKRFEEYKKLEN